ncbi:MAG: PQQ-binding-like beta-propeller repeat protein [Acetobacteraceae bacterium]|nr:PQQ-binding-like beta-propeller repeat protein [Acetobacteraceae bacterium]
MSLRRRALMLGLPFAVSGCGLFDSILGENKAKLSGTREAILGSRGGLTVDAANGQTVTVPAPINVAEWVEAGGNATHAFGNIAVTGLKPAWTADVGAGGGYRAKLTAQPLIQNGSVYTMDSDGKVSAFDLATGSRRWHTDTQADDNRSTNIGGGIAIGGGKIYATTGRGEALALDAGTGAIQWRKDIGVPARSGPTLSNNRMHFTTIDDQLLALSLPTGERAWSYTAETAKTTVLTDAAPAISDGFVVAGFGSGELVSVRADSGVLAWSDTLASSRGRNSSVDLSAIRALPVIDSGRLYAIGVGGLMVSLDLRSGRRLWERDVGGGQTPWLAGEWLFVQTSGQALAAINAGDGRVRWIQDLPRWDNPAKERDPIFWSGPLMVNGKLLLAGTSSTAVTINPLDGRILGTQTMSSSVSVAPVAAAGTVLILCNDGTLQAFR